MRSKFSDLIQQGVASFSYTNLHQEVPVYDEICRQYNNIFSMALDTHMSILDNGTRVITGHNIADGDKWSEFLHASKWGGYDFTDSGVYSLAEFLASYNLTGEITLMNNDVVFLVTELAQETE